MPTNTNNELTENNRKAWNTCRYDAWISAYGGVDEEARRIVSNPEHPIRRISPHLQSISGKRICSVQGSNGRIAVALAVLGAKVHVIDFAAENRRFAMDLASAANVSLEYVVSDILEADSLDLPHKFDVLVLELGILHYHQNIDRFFAVMRYLLKDGGILFLNEFHPVQRKLYWKSGPQNYFSDELIEADVPNPDTEGSSLGKCQYRFWTLSQIFGALIGNGFSLSFFDEHPHQNSPELPGTFTLVAHT